jgi:hypothetical protein
LREIVLNEGLQKIGQDAFWRCSSLESITFPSTVTEIGRGAFMECRNLQEAGLHEGLQKIGDSSFGICSSLQSITLPSILTEIDKAAFWNCNSLRGVVFNNGLQKITQGVFADCISLQSISLPSTLTEIDKYAFVNCTSLREVRLHEGLQTVGIDAFASCTSLERFTFPSISIRLNNVIEVETEVNRTRQLNEIDTIRGDMIVRRGSELFIPGAVLRGGSNWNTIKASLDQIVCWIRYHEIKEETTLFELALWKAKIDQADEATDINREAYRVEVPGPVKDAILQYL